jgi:hypothetical protein
VIDEALQRLLAIEELDSQVLRTVARHKLQVCCRTDQRVGPIEIQDRRLRPGSHEDVYSHTTVWVEIQSMEVQLVAMRTLSTHSSDKYACRDQTDKSILRFNVGMPVPYPSILVDVRVLLLESCHAEDHIVVGNIDID